MMTAKFVLSKRVISNIVSELVIVVTHAVETFILIRIL